MKVFIDIETIPTQKMGPDEFRDQVKVPGNYKKPETIEQYKADNAEAEWRKTALDGTQGEIVCIGWAVEDGETKSVQRAADGDEGELLNRFWGQLMAAMGDEDYLTRPVWVGHNITGFDLRFMWHRSVINGIQPEYNLHQDAKPWSKDVIDTLYLWKGNNIAGGSLDRICTAFGLDGKGDIDGSKVWDYVRDGKIDEVAAYCRDDVEKTRAIYKRMMFIK